MPNKVIKVEGLSKRYRYGAIGHGTLYKDLESWWARIRGKEDPNLRITEHIGPGLEGEWFWALRDVSFEVQQGEVLGIVGRNGAGKSTLLKVMSRVTTPTNGVIKIKGRVASLLEIGTGFHQELSGRDNIYLNGAILGMTKAEVRSKFDEIVDFSGLEKFIDTPVKRYSSGMYVRLAFAVAAHLEPEILFVDEVLAVGDVEFQKKCLGKMEDVAKEGRTILFVSHNMAAIRSLCRRTILLDKGGLLMDSATNQAVAYYLSQNLIEGAVASKEQIESRMEGLIRRRNPFVRFREIALLDRSGATKRSFHSDEDIIVSVSFECLQPIPQIYIRVTVVDENAIPVLESINLDDPIATQDSKQFTPGVYNASCVLPKNTFGGRQFYLTVHLVYLKTEHVFVNKILEFDVIFKGYNSRYEVTGDVFIRPQLSWTIQPGCREQLNASPK
ncbi:MAG: polysaccharide ABC transporter ATP-binding protein [Phycisphaerae bacterium]|nr:polysaccharide ABC transporter ATP-binding protein [Phycisphaerae bacterium]